LQTISLKAEPAKEVPKTTSAAKGSWGKTPVPPTGAAKPSKTAADGTKILYSNTTSGIPMPVKTNMFEADRV